MDQSELRHQKRLEHVNDLDIWQKANTICQDVMKLTQHFPVSEWSGLAQRLKNTALDLPITIEKGFNRRNFSDKLHFYLQARDLLDELAYLLKVSEDMGHIKNNEDLHRLMDETSIMFTGLIKSMDKRLKSVSGPTR